jgi:hypothetical protein
VGTAKTRNGTRHPPQAASTPASSGPMNAPIAFAARWKENTRGRAAIGNQSASSELWVGHTVASPTPEPARISTSIHTATDRPVPTVNRANTEAPTSMSRTRLWRSASQAMGTWSASPSSDATATSERMPVLVSSKWSRMLGSNSPKPVRSNSSTMLNPNSTSNA